MAESGLLRLIANQVGAYWPLVGSNPTPTATGE